MKTDCDEDYKQDNGIGTGGYGSGFAVSGPGR